MGLATVKGKIANICDFIWRKQNINHSLTKGKTLLGEIGLLPIMKFNKAATIF